MDWTITIAAVLAVWAALRVLGNERQRRLEEMVAQTPLAPAPPAGPDGTPVVS